MSNKEKMLGKYEGDLDTISWPNQYWKEKWALLLLHMIQILKI